MGARIRRRAGEEQEEPVAAGEALVERHRQRQVEGVGRWVALHLLARRGVAMTLAWGSSSAMSNEIVTPSSMTSCSGLSGFDRSPRMPGWTHGKWLKSTKFSTRRAAEQAQS
jgi:hypothetical protein